MATGPKFCKSYKIDRLVYIDHPVCHVSFDDMRKAIDREKRLKGWLRMKKIRLIVSMNPTTSDLSDGW